MKAKLFQSEDTTGTLVMIPNSLLNNSEETKKKLKAWLFNKKSDIFWDIEGQEGLAVQVKDWGSQGLEVTFWGDNGLWRLNEVEAEVIED